MQYMEENHCTQSKLGNQENLLKFLVQNTEENHYTQNKLVNQENILQFLVQNTEENHCTQIKLGNQENLLQFLALLPHLAHKRFWLPFLLRLAHGSHSL